MKIVWSWGVVLFTVGTLIAFGLALANTEQFVGAEWLLLVANCIFFAKLSTAPALSENHRPAWIAATFIVVGLVTVSEWRWVEGQRPPLDYSQNIAAINSIGAQDTPVYQLTVPVTNVHVKEERVSRGATGGNAIGTSRRRFEKPAPPNAPQIVQVEVH